MTNTTRASKLLIALVIAACVVVIFLIVAPFVLPGPSRPASTVCLYNVKAQACALLMYRDDNNGYLPRGDNWTGVVRRYWSMQWGPNSTRDLTALLTCPALSRGEVGGYAYNSALMGALSPSNGSRIIMIFESRQGRNLCGGQELLLEKPRHQDRCVLGWLDGHCTAPPRAAIERARQAGHLFWDPPTTNQKALDSRPAPSR